MATMEKAGSKSKTSKTHAVQPSSWNEMIDRWFAELPRSRFWPELPGFGAGFEPLRVEEFTEGDENVVRAEMPGIDPEKDVQITVSDHRLHLRAERREEVKTEEQGGYRSEFRYGIFARDVPLPVGATDKDVKATYRDGILEVRITLDRDEIEAKKVPVQRA
jgi:HSP20 family protein